MMTPGPVGVYVATGGVVSSYLVNRLSFSSELPGYTGGIAHIGNDKDFPSTRISYKLNLTGPSINVQTACSSSLVAAHLACQAIVAGECDMALAGAATVRIPQHAGHMSVKGGILSPDGHCRAFDADAQGTIFGSGVGLVLLKDLSRAIADRDNIYAVIRGSAVNNDGARKVSYTASSVAAQSKAMVEAMVVAGVSPDQIGYVECHGTGTVVGDPLEIDALTKAFRTATNRRGFCAVGSVKTNIGHLEQTAGVAALIKAALTLKNRKIPASLHFQRPNPKIDFDESPFFVNASSRDWPQENGPRFAAVNSLGLGGTNAFAVLEEAPLREADGGPERAADISVHLFGQDPIGAAGVNGKTSLMDQSMSWAQRARSVVHPDQRSNPLCKPILRAGRLAGTIAKRAHRGSHDEPEGAEETGSRRLGFLFSGQGSQYAGMGKELYHSHPVFRATVDRCAGALRDSLPGPLLEALFGEGDAASLIHETAIYPACSLCCTGCAHGFVALMGHGSRCCVGPQRRGVCRGLLRRGVHARGLSEAGSRSRKADAGSSAPRDHGLDLRRRSDRSQGDRATQFQAHRHRGAERAREYGDLRRSRSGRRDNGEPQRRRRSVSAINGLACVSFAFDPAGN